MFSSSKILFSLLILEGAAIYLETMYCQMRVANLMWT